MRVALFNVKELSLSKMEAATGTAGAEQVRAAATIIASTAPDILVLQEIDQGSDDDPAAVARVFADQLRETGIDYPYVFSAPSNTGRLTGIDLDQDGTVATATDQGTRAHGNDSFGFGTYPGQYSMAVLSRLPFGSDRTRTFQTFLWRDLPGNHIDTDLEQPFLTAEARSLFRLSSKSHWDLPVLVPNGPALHLLISHPTPPVFDGPEDRNGRRNFDEIKFWADYLDNSDALVDDAGARGGFGDHHDRVFVIAGDLNAFPEAAAAGNALYDGRTAISQLLDHPLVQESGPWLTSEGAVRHAGQGAGAPDFKERATAGFNRGARIDYLLPSRNVRIADGGVFWPDPDQDPAGAELALLASDHRLIWLDLKLKPLATEAARAGDS